MSAIKNAVLRLRPATKFLILSSMTVALSFFDVVFQGTSISMFDQYNASALPREVHTLLPEKPGIAPYEGYYDAGGAALQSEPAIQFMKHSIYNFESPFWNPYSGAGSFGPETMVDIKFSPLSLLVAALGGSNLAFHFVTLIFYVIAVFFMYRVLIEQLGFSYPTAVASGFVYLLNGYFTANISSNTSQSYLYFPLALFSVIRFTRKPSTLNFYFLIFAYVLPLLVTFFPTTILVLTTVAVTALAATVSQYPRRKQRIRILSLHAAAPVIAGLLLAFMYIPLAEALKYLSAVENYGLRSFYGANWLGFVSFITPKHFFLSYNAMNPDFLPFVQNAIFHFGIIPVLVASLVIFSKRWLKEPLLFSFVALLSIAIARIFSVPVISHIIDVIPIYRNLGEQYCWMMVACAFPIVFAFGFEGVAKARLKIWPAVLVLAIMVAQLTYIGLKFGLPVEQQKFSGVHTPGAHVAIALGIALVTSLLLWRLCAGSEKRRSLLLGLLVAGVFCELMYDMDTARFERTEPFKNPTADIVFLKSNVGEYRVANYGSIGFPPESGEAYQIPQIEYFSMNIMPRYYDLCQRDLTTEHSWYGKGVFCVNKETSSPPNVSQDMLNMLSVKYVVLANSMPQFKKLFDERKFKPVFSMPSLDIYENPFAFPRAFAVPNIYESPLTPETKGQSGRNVAFTDDSELVQDAGRKGIAIGLPDDRQESGLFKGAKITSYENTKVQIDVRLSAPGILVLMDNWHPGWGVRVDGSPAYLGRVNQSFRGVALTSGHHFVEMNYTPTHMSVALCISVASLLLLFLGAFYRVEVDHKFHRLLQ